MSIVCVNDIDMYYEIHGEGEPLVLIAGLNSDHTLYRTALPRLAAHNQVIINDYTPLGHPNWLMWA